MTMKEACTSQLLKAPSSPWELLSVHLSAREDFDTQAVLFTIPYK